MSTYYLTDPSENYLSELVGKKQQGDVALEKQYKQKIFSKIEIHPRVFEIKYACFLYLGVKLGDPIKAKHIYALIDNQKYIKDHCKYGIIDYFIFINKKIETLETKLKNLISEDQSDEQEKKRLIDEKIELESEKKTIIYGIVDLTNNLVYQKRQNIYTSGNNDIQTV